MIILQIIGILVGVCSLGLLINGIEEYNRGVKAANKFGTFSLVKNTSFGIPLIQVHQGDKEFYFVIDTGATNSSINQSDLDNFEHLKLNTQGSVYGMEGNIVDVSFVRAAFNIDSEEFIDEFQVVDLSKCFDLSHSNCGFHITGILSSEFLKRYSLSVDVCNNVLYRVYDLLSNRTK